MYASFGSSDIENRQRIDDVYGESFYERVGNDLQIWKDDFES